MTTEFSGHCAHCGTYSDLLGGYAQGVRLCHPDDGLDCYRLVTVYDEPIGSRKPGGELHGAPNPITNLDFEIERWSKVLDFLAER
ncbi:hypothetical protein [Gordonia paraffinivorans]|uniref:hypothetical protein n=1 Tax=Gordonia paraffinivorans TaxID=175628 RepID=UPI003FCE4903